MTTLGWLWTMNNNTWMVVEINDNTWMAVEINDNTWMVAKHE